MVEVVEDGGEEEKGVVVGGVGRAEEGGTGG